MALRIERSELRRSPQELANEILALCQLSATRAQRAYRHELAELGCSHSVIAALGLPSDDDLAVAEQNLLGESAEHAAPVERMGSE